MAKSRTVTIFQALDDPGEPTHANEAGGRDWAITARVSFGYKGSYWDPPDGDEVEILGVVEDIYGPTQRFTWDEFVAHYGLTESDVAGIEEDAITAAYED